MGGYRTALLAAGFLFLPAGLLGFLLPDLADEECEPYLAGEPIAELAE